jgi:hypothetical protein
MQKFDIFAMVVLLLALVSYLAAEVPQMINYQGRLTDSEGNPVADNTYEVTFRIYDETSTERWSEMHSVATIDGLFSVQLGSGNSPLGASIFNYAECWLGITITGEDEMTPRTQLIATPYAFRISTVDGASGGIISGNITVQDNLTVTGSITVQDNLALSGDLQVSGDVIGSTSWTAFPYNPGYGDWEDANPGYNVQVAQYRKIGDIV